MGTFAVPIEWTDQEHNFNSDKNKTDGLFIDFACLLLLNDLLKNFNISEKIVDK